MLDPVDVTLRHMPARQRQRAEAFLRDFEWTWTKAVVFCLIMWFIAITFLAVIPSFWLYYSQRPPLRIVLSFFLKIVATALKEQTTTKTRCSRWQPRSRLSSRAR